MKPLIIDIRRFALEDGPGIRTTVYMKGCSLDCKRCHTPAAKSIYREMVFFNDRCLSCGQCQQVCPSGAATIQSKERISPVKCMLCGLCVKNCSGRALRRVGSYYSAEELSKLIVKGRNIYMTSGGGVTFAGGEPTMHMDYLAEVMRELKQYGVHIAIQTCGMFAFNEFMEKLLPFIDLIYYDIKFVDDEKHIKYTGESNELILDNFLRLTKETKVKIIPRTPLVTWITDEQDNIKNIIRFVTNAGYRSCDYLIYVPKSILKKEAFCRPEKILMTEHIKQDA